MRMYPEPSDRVMNSKPARPSMTDSFIDVVVYVLSLFVFIAVIVCPTYLVYESFGTFLAICVALAIVTFLCNTWRWI